MTLEKIVGWLDQTLNVAAFDDVSNNGLQIERRETQLRTAAFGCLASLGCARLGRGVEPQLTNAAGEDAPRYVVAIAVDASLKSVEAAAAAGAQLLVVHHGISWGGGIKRLTGGVYNVVKAAMDANLAVYACHLPLDAHQTLGNNAQLAKLLGLKQVKPAFPYHGNVIGFTGVLSDLAKLEKLVSRTAVRLARGVSRTDGVDGLKSLALKTPCTIGICSGGAAEFAEDAKRLGCAVLVTGEANWADVIAAENCGAKMLCLGHYETEVYGVRAVAAAMKKQLKVKIVDLTSP